MSSTNRKTRKGNPDVYYTPKFCTLRLLEALSPPGGVWLEAGAGHGSIIQAVNEVRSDIVWVAYELREECRETLDRLATVVRIGDVLAMQPRDHRLALQQVSHKPRFDVCIMNPPFRLAFEFLQMALSFCDYVIMLQRLNYLGSRQRSEFFQMYPPDVYVLPDRPSFEGGQSDSIEYAWFVWGPGDRVRPDGRIRMLDRTPVEARGRGRRGRVIDVDPVVPTGLPEASPVEPEPTPMGDPDEHFNPDDAPDPIVNEEEEEIHEQTTE